jgi:hypothetical protein
VNNKSYSKDTSALTQLLTLGLLVACYNKIEPSTCRILNHTGNKDTYIIKISYSDMPVILCKKYKLHKTLTE